MIALPKSLIKELPQRITRVVMVARGNTKPPEGWVEVPGAQHRGRNIWMIPLKRVETPNQPGQETP